jgi:hypothetical protein
MVDMEVEIAEIFHRLLDGLVEGRRGVEAGIEGMMGVKGGRMVGGGGGGGLKL